MPTKNETTEKDIAAPEKTVKALTASAPLVVLANKTKRTHKNMNTRKSDYTLDEHGIIRDLGKFEGEMYYIPYFYDVSLEGLGGDPVYSGESQVAEVFGLTSEDKARFPELANVSTLILTYSGQGFVYGTTDTRQASEVLAELENENLEP